MNSKLIIIAGIVIGVAAIAGIELYATANQHNNLSDDLVLSQAAEEGSFASSSGLGADLNKEQWHEDPFGDIAQKVREEAGR